jgi:hypothetical protein
VAVPAVAGRDGFGGIEDFLRHDETHLKGSGMGRTKARAAAVA